MVTVITFYRFVTIDEPAHLQAELRSLLKSLSIRGTVIVATEGINGTIAGDDGAITRFGDWLGRDPRFHNMPVKVSQAESPPFHRTRVKLKSEIVTMGIDGIDPATLTGTYIKPKDWNALISDPDVMVVDTRNDYEVRIGTFKGAINPGTSNFREFPAFAQNLAESETPPSKVAMFCTGGIRCEKSTAHLKSLGVEEVYHLEGGILRYLEEVPEAQSQWQGECFVFDSRVTVDHQLRPGGYDQCHACRMPISEVDKQHPAFVRGVSCPHCEHQYSESDRDRFREREKQMRLAREREESHLGQDAATHAEHRRHQKKTDRVRQRKQ
ncbi:MAG: hypothetical protein CMP98_12575 [Gammaproteobacteria bacterium]|nr:hypothetical protein [Gammaproteobacteria bacterium]OUU07515.1 MAG: hypothetical protein CBB94_13205 [Gammaproteobacteria bacterium TMED34]